MPAEKRERIDAKKVYSTWKCPDCGKVSRWDFQDVAEGGQPVCVDCDRDMEFTGQVYLVKGARL